MNVSSIRCCVLLLVLFELSGPVHAAETKRARGSMGIGVILGDPTGFTGKLWVGGNKAIDGLVAWSFRRDFFFIQSHYLIHFHETYVEDKRFLIYAGPGGYTRFGEGKDRLGVSGNFGIAYIVDQFEIFLELSPKVSIVPDTDGEMTGGVGFHYYF